MSLLKISGDLVEKRRTQYSETGFLILFWMLVLALVCVATWANLDLTRHRAALFMDEMIPFDNVKRILTASSPKALVWAISDGGDHRYGRIFYNVSALTGWLPYRLAGDTGLIIAIRSTQVVLLIGAMVIFCLGLIRSWVGRALALMAMTCLPYTDYYLTQPKPEAVQLLCYALFTVCAVRRKFAFGWHWIFLGLAFGAKISAAPLCASVAMLAIVHLWLYAPGWKHAISSGIMAGVGFIAGWIIAIPMLAVPTRERLDAYLGWTFKATGHGSDDSRTTILDWLKSLLTGGEVVRGAYPSWVAIALLAAITLVLLLSLLCAGWRRPRLNLRDFFEVYQAWLILGLAAALLLPIMLAVKRLWGIYLFPGQLFAIVALAGITGQLLAANKLPRWMKLARWVAVFALVGLTLIASHYCSKSGLRQYRQLAHRTSEPGYLKNLAIYEASLTELAAMVVENRRRNGGPLEVLYDPNLFPPESTPDMNVQPFWAATIYWGRNPAVILMGRPWHLSYFLHEKPLPPPTSASFSALQTAVEEFSVHVQPDPSVTSDKPYQLVRWFGEDAAMILRKDFAERWRASVQEKSTPPTLPH